ncbi:MAG: hypothetical protein JXB62_06375 [Pirellulales bacterium]|nr:hypothetical protein [Pirellulales bacterium]
MKLLGSTLFVCLVVFGSATAWAQYGLYGSPEMLDLPQVGSETVPCSWGPSPAGQFAALATAGQPVAPGMVSTTPTPNGQWNGFPMAAAGRRPKKTAEPAPPQAVDAQNVLRSDSAPAAAPNVVDQMLSESPIGEPSGEYLGPDSGSCGPCNQYGDVVYQYGECEPPCCSDWYVSVLGLVMGRDAPNRVWTTYETGAESNQLELDVLGWRWGAEIRFGRRFCCNQWALEAVYWTLDAFEDTRYRSHVNGVGTPLVVSGIEFAGRNGTLLFDSAAGHRLTRYNEFHNIELNLIRNQMTSSDYTALWDIDWLVGMRYFRFEEHWLFGSVAGGYWWGQDPSQEAFLDERITNNMLGFQFGLDASYYFNPAWRFFLMPRFGIYNNHIDQYFNAYLGDGTVANPTAASGQTGSYPVIADKDVVSFLTQIDIGLDWQIAPQWTLRAGYRVVLATGIGLADNQIPPYIVDIPELASIDHNGDLILHGATLGVTYNF